MTQVTVPTPVAFSTVGLPDEQRIELWEGHNADALIGLRCRTLTAAVLEATEISGYLSVKNGWPARSSRRPGSTPASSWVCERYSATAAIRGCRVASR
jgi:hypothetical protein